MSGIDRLAAGFCAFLALWWGCERETRKFSSSPEHPIRHARLSTLQPGGAQPEAVRQGPYDGNAWAISEGQRLYNQYNCVGCHSHGGGGIGPALMDSEWIYGSGPQNIHDTIAEGRPNGMPSYGGHIPDDQIWKIEAYVRTLSGQGSKAARPGRRDHMAARPSEQATPKRKPTGAPAEHPQ